MTSTKAVIFLQPSCLFINIDSGMLSRIFF